MWCEAQGALLSGFLGVSVVLFVENAGFGFFSFLSHRGIIPPARDAAAHALDTNNSSPFPEQPAPMATETRPIVPSSPRGGPYLLHCSLSGRPRRHIVAGTGRDYLGQAIHSRKFMSTRRRPASVIRHPRLKRAWGIQCPSIRLTRRASSPNSHRETYRVRSADPRI